MSEVAWISSETVSSSGEERIRRLRIDANAAIKSIQSEAQKLMDELCDLLVKAGFEEFSKKNSKCREFLFRNDRVRALAKKEGQVICELNSLLKETEVP